MNTLVVLQKLNDELPSLSPDVQALVCRAVVSCEEVITERDRIIRGVFHRQRGSGADRYRQIRLMIKSGSNEFSTLRRLGLPVPSERNLKRIVGKG